TSHSGFTRAGEASKPQDGGAVSITRFTHLAADLSAFPDNIARFAAVGLGADDLFQGAGAAADHAGGDSDIAKGVNENKAARVAVELVGVKEERLRCRNLGAPNLV